MRSLLCASLVLLFATTATAQFAKNPALAKKPADAEVEKKGDKPAGIPANVDDPAVPPAGGAAPAAPAAGAGAASNNLFAALDTDGDGVISKLELRKASLSLKVLDKDKDGTISLAECGATAAAGAGVAGNEAMQWLDRIMDKDKNKDGKLTPDELTEGEKQMLQGADLNGDGAIDRQELTAMGNHGGANNGQGNGFANGNSGGVNGRRGGNEAMARFFQYDRNHDGRLTANEVPQQAMAMLQGGDTNGDGGIDAAELQAIAAKMGDRMKAWNAGADPKAAGVNGDPNESDAKNRRRPLRNDKNDKNQN